MKKEDYIEEIGRRGKFEALKEAAVKELDEAANAIKEIAWDDGKPYQAVNGAVKKAELAIDFLEAIAKVI